MRRAGLITFLAGLVLFLTAAPPAAAAPRLVRVATTAASPATDGRLLLWRGAAGTLGTLDPVTGVRGTLALGDGCRWVAVGTGVIAVRCGTSGSEDTTSYAVDTRTGMRTLLDGVPYPLEIGSQWVGYLGGGLCYHCETRAYRNWHTGEIRELDGMDDRPVDLDSVPFRQIPLRLGRAGLVEAIALGARSLVIRLADPAPGQYEVTVVEAGRSRVIGRCDDGCFFPTLTASRAAWIDGDRHPVLRAFGLGTRHRTAWPITGYRPRSAYALAVQDRLLLVRPGRTKAAAILRAVP